MTKQKTETANEYTDIKDIKGNFLYRRDGYILVFLRVYSYNLDLVSTAERKGKVENLSASFGGDKKDFNYFSVPREMDLDDYKAYLSNAYQNEQDSKYSFGRRAILRILLKEAQILSTSGENYEHQHFIKLWARLGKNPQETCHNLLERAEEFRQRYDAVGIKLELLDEVGIIKLCNLFANGQQAPYEVYTKEDIDYIPLPTLKDDGR